jgi:hypothetical protein
MSYTKGFVAKITLQRYNRIYGSDFSHCQDIPSRGKQSGLVRMFLVQLGFHQTPIHKCTIMA